MADLKMQINWLVQLAARGLNRVFPSNSPALFVRLYTNDVTPGADNALGDFVEAVGGGYVPSTISGTFVNTRVGDAVESTPPDVVFTFSGALTGPSDVVGAYLTDAAGNFVAAARLSAAHTPAADTRLTIPLTLSWAAGVAAEPTGNQAPSAPAISLVGVASGQATLRLDTASTDPDGSVSGYLVYVNGVQAGGLRSWSQGTNQTVTALVNGVTVALTAKAQDNDGALSAASNTVNATPANQAPTAPVISVPSTGDTTATVRLVTGSTDTEDGTITTYDVFVNGVQKGSDVTGWDAGEDRVVTGLTNGVQVALTVKGKDAAGLLGAASNSVNATPSGTADTTPDAFTFTDQTGVALSSTITSAPITVSGISAAAAISVTGGTYSLDGGGYTSASGSVTNGQQVRARHTSSGSFNTAVGTTVTIGGVSDTFTSTTAAQDTVPDAFSFTDATNQAINTVVASAPITVAGINAAAAISVTGGSYRINGTGSWLTTSGTVANGDTVEARGTSSGSYSTAVNVVVTIGGVSDTFTITTAAQDTTPDAFSFTDQTNVALSTLTESNAITVAGINAAAAISVTGGEYQISGGSWVSSSGTVTNGQTVKVRQTSSSSNSTQTDCVLTIGGVSDTFSLTTVAGLSWQTVLADNFERADQTPASSPWVTDSWLTPAPNLAGNKISKPSPNGAYYMYHSTGTSFNDDQFCQADVNIGEHGYAGLIVRLQPAPIKRLIISNIHWGLDGNYAEIFWQNGAATGQIGANITLTAQPTSMRLEAVEDGAGHTVVTLYINGASVSSQSIDSLTGGKPVGISIGGGEFDTTYMDNFSCGHKA